MPRIIGAILDSRSCWLGARLILTFVFWSAGIGQLVTFQASAAQMAALNLTPGALYAALVPATLLAGSVMIIIDRWTWLSAGMLSTFLVLAIPLVHPFWSMTGPRADDEMRLVFEHVTVIGGLMAIAIASRQHRLLRAAP